MPEGTWKPHEKQYGEFRTYLPLMESKRMLLPCPTCGKFMWAAMKFPREPMREMPGGTSREDAPSIFLSLPLQ